MDIATDIKEYVLEEGADLVGIAPVVRFDGAPRGHHPRDLLPTAKSVVSFGMRLIDATVDYPEYLLDAESRIPKDTRAPLLVRNFYLEMGHFVQDRELNRLALKLALKLEKQGLRSMATPATQEASELLLSDHFGFFSQRHAAVRAGLGEFGYNNIVLNPEFGPRVRYGSVITEAECDYDPLLTEPVCLREGCRDCLEACKGDAITLQEGVDPDRVFIDTPAVTDPTMCLQREDGRIRIGCTFYGSCLRVCPVRINLEDYAGNR
jgi:epoxyqueuosine reductase QueG